MMFDLPNDDALYAALIARDASFDGRAFVGVTSTGVFCRLTCPARKPKRQNCVFFDQIGSCIEAGFRACLRCHPMAPAAQSDPAVAQLLTALKADPARRWGEADVQALGLDASTVRRAFKRHFGMTFLEMARLTRLRTGAAVSPAGGKVIDAQKAAGKTRSYSDVARAMGRPNATRAVARANGANPIAAVIPCHRVLGADGALTGYGGGLWRKRALIDLERGHAAQRRNG